MPPHRSGELAYGAPACRPSSSRQRASSPPFFFVYNPALLFEGSWTEILRAVVTGSIGVIALAASMEGNFLRTASWFERALFLAVALLPIDPGFVTDVIGMALLAFALLLQKVRPIPTTVTGGANT